MEFIVESNHEVTMACGDLLLTTNSIHDIIWLVCKMYDNKCCITAASRGRFSGDLDLDSIDSWNAHDNTIINITRLLYSKGGIVGVWCNIPQSLWYKIYGFIVEHVY